MTPFGGEVLGGLLSPLNEAAIASSARAITALLGGSLRKRADENRALVVAEIEKIVRDLSVVNRVPPEIAAACAG